MPDTENDTASKPLDAREQRFVDEYMVDLDVERAAVAAGYSQSMARSKAYQWVSNSKVKPHVFAAIEGRRKALQAETEVTQERIIAELAKIGFANMADYMKADEEGDPHLDFSSLSRDQAAALSEVTVDEFKEGKDKAARTVRRVKFKLADKRQALCDMGKYLGMFTDRVQPVGKDGKPIDPVASVVHVYLPGNGRD